ncbi:MAG TPA: DNA repair protein RecO [Candidatus Sulfotelmatobacter sp.]|jgi:recombinational DNA repair protein (RecF pathway)|nr:DNA repair protein RecO [Candidatus Sulfotelmatobacter sp.]
MRNFRTEGIVIKRRNFNEADRIITVMTRDYGKIQIRAAGVRKITSRRAAHIELLNHTVLHLYKGNTFAILTEAKMIDDFSSIKENFEKIGLAYHLCELVDGLCPDNQENGKVFELLQKTLRELSQQNEVYRPHYATQEIDDYTLGTFGIEVVDSPRLATHKSGILEYFESSILSDLGYWDKNDTVVNQFNTHDMIENILERKLKSRSIFAKLQ